MRGTAADYNSTRALWRKGLSALRRRYADEATAVADEAARVRAAEVARVQEEKQVRLKAKLARSAKTRECVDADRAAMAVAYEKQRAKNSTVRARREADAGMRLALVVDYLEAQSSNWLTPHHVDVELTAAFLEGPGNTAIGHSAERSPYWGYLAEVEPVMPREVPRVSSVFPPLAYSTDGQLRRSAEEAMSLATSLLSTHAANYKEYKTMRENVDDLEKLIELLREADIVDTDAPVNVKAKFGYSGSGGSKGIASFRSSAADNARPPMPRMPLVEQEKLAAKDQLERLRARRQLRPSPNEPAPTPGDDKVVENKGGDEGK